MVPHKHLTGNFGGPFWHALRLNPDHTPPFEKLSKSTLWADAKQYEVPVWSWLCGGGGRGFNVDIGRALNPREGDPVPVDIEVGERKARLLVGEVGPILRKRPILDLVYVELSAEATGLPA